MVMVGSNPRAANAAGVSTATAVTVAYVIAGACSAVSGVLLAARYGSGDMELGAGYDYTAIAAVLVGYFRANPILVSIAGLSLLIGFAALATGGERIYPGGEGLQMFKGRVAGIPVEALYFFATVAIGQFILSWTRIGRVMVMVGSNPRAAQAAGVGPEIAVTVAYVLAGACSAVSGVLLAARYGSGDMELGTGYDYTAIAAVLVGGTAIQGGSGSVVRTLAGVTVIAIIEVVLLLRGFSQQLQYFITGVIVLAVIMLHTIGERR
jgi:ribose/xylose/arabinose/galactoside ABC-type transport system permease subunit